MKRLKSEFRQDGEIERNCLGCFVIEGYLHKKKGKVYKVAVRPALTCGSEMWGIERAQEDKLDVVDEDAALGEWTHADGLSEEQSDRERMKVIELHQKVQEKRLRWYSHELRRRKPPNKVSIGDGSGEKEKPGETEEKMDGLY